MPRHGGARKGAGRPKGSANKLTTEIAAKAMKGGITPLEVMLYAMRESFDGGNMKEATTYANMAAPYCHPRLNAVSSDTRVQAELVVIDEFGDSIVP